MSHKMIKVEKDTHDKAKKQAYERGMTLQGYIKFLINKQEKETK